MGAFSRFIGGNGFDQTDGADRDHIVLFGVTPIVFFDDVRHQTQIVFDQFIPCRHIARAAFFEQFFLFLFGKRGRKRPRPRYVQRKIIDLRRHFQ